MVRPLVTTVFLLCAFVVASNAQPYCVDLTSGLVSNLPAGNTQVNWTKTPSNSGPCQMQGVLKITPPSRNRSVVVVMNFVNSTKYSFNLGDSPTNNAWGGDYWTTKDDAEIHSYDKWFRVYLSEKAGTKALVLQPAVQTQVFIQLWRNQIFASGGGGFFFFKNANGLFAMDTMYLGLNRVIDNYQGSTSRTGSGLCKVCISII